MSDRPADLVTAGLRLVALTPDEAAAVIASGLPLPSGPLADLEGSRGWPHADTVDALGMHAEHGSIGPYCSWLVVVDGSVVGDVGCHGGPDSDGVVEIGYGIAAPSRRRGYATEAVGALVSFLAVQPAVSTIRASTHEGNSPSRHVLDRVGFVPIGREGDHGETVVYEHIAEGAT